jgi:hypothetical protein
VLLEAGRINATIGLQAYRTLRDQTGRLFAAQSGRVPAGFDRFAQATLPQAFASVGEM